MRVKDVLHASFCSKNGQINKNQTFNPQLSFWQVLNKYCVFWLFYIDLLLQCCLWWHHCDYAWVASCTFGQLCGLLSSFVESLSMRKHLYNSSALYFLKHSELRHNAAAHMKMLFLEYFFLSETESFHKYKKRTKNNLIEVWRKQLSILSCCFFLPTANSH